MCGYYKTASRDISSIVAYTYLKILSFDEMLRLYFRLRLRSIWSAWYGRLVKFMTFHVQKRFCHLQ